MNSLTFSKADRICDTLDEDPRLWNVYGDTIRDVITRAEEEILKLRSDKDKLYGTGPEKATTVRAQQIWWKKKLWNERPHVCDRCSCEVTWAIHRIHHKTPVSDGGEFSDENLEVLCANCHLAEHES